MSAPTVFATLCDLVDALQRVVRDLPHSPQQLALEALVHRFDLLIDQTIGLEVPALEEEEDGDDDATPDALMPGAPRA